MEILLIEDDDVQAGDLREALDDAFDHLKVGRVATVAELVEQIALLESHPPDLVILDGILPWSLPSSKDVKLPTPKELGDPYSGGRQCLKVLSRNTATRDIPVIVYSVLAEDRFFGENMRPKPHVFFVRKTGAGFGELIVNIRSLCFGHAARRRKTLRERLTEVIDVKLGALGVSFDLKRFLRRR